MTMVFTKTYMAHTRSGDPNSSPSLVRQSAVAGAVKSKSRLAVLSQGLQCLEMNWTPKKQRVLLGATLYVSHSCRLKVKLGSYVTLAQDCPQGEIIKKDTMQNFDVVLIVVTALCSALD